jgi:hypothetical protein
LPSHGVPRRGMIDAAATPTVSVILETRVVATGAGG